MRNNKQRTLMTISLLVALILSIAAGSMGQFAAQCETVRANTLRLHILAHSDDPADQQLKLRVRDRILAESGRLFAGGATAEEAAAIADSHLAEIEAVVRDELEKQGSSQTVRAERVRMYFTTRRYDGFTLPAGMYEAVRITLGEGKGHNWWCVLFPPLCLGASAESLEVFGDAADLVADSGRYALRFKCVEWFEGIRQALAGSDGAREAEPAGGS